MPTEDRNRHSSRHHKDSREPREHGERIGINRLGSLATGIGHVVEVNGKRRLKSSANVEIIGDEPRRHEHSRRRRRSRSIPRQKPPSRNHSPSIIDGTWERPRSPRRLSPTESNIRRDADQFERTLSSARQRAYFNAMREELEGERDDEVIEVTPRARSRIASASQSERQSNALRSQRGSAASGAPSASTSAPTERRNNAPDSQRGSDTPGAATPRAPSTASQDERRSNTPHSQRGSATPRALSITNSASQDERHSNPPSRVRDGAEEGGNFNSSSHSGRPISEAGSVVPDDSISQVSSQNARRRAESGYDDYVSGARNPHGPASAASARRHGSSASRRTVPVPEAFDVGSSDGRRSIGQPPDYSSRHSRVSASTNASRRAVPEAFEAGSSDGRRSIAQPPDYSSRHSRVSASTEGSGRSTRSSAHTATRPAGNGSVRGSAYEATRRDSHRSDRGSGIDVMSALSNASTTPSRRDPDVEEYSIADRSAVSSRSRRRRSFDDPH